MFSVSFLEAFLMDFGCSREPPARENSLKFMQPSSKIKVRRICGQGGFEMLPGSIFLGFWHHFVLLWSALGGQDGCIGELLF